MKNNYNYDRSRQNSEIALNRINDILTKYSSCPDSKNMKEEEISWLNEKIRNLGECIKQTNYKKFIFYEDFRNIRNELAHSRDLSNSEEINNIWEKSFNWFDKAQIELKENIKRISSPNKIARRYEKFSSSKNEDEFVRKNIIDAITDNLNSDIEEKDKIPYPKGNIAKQAEQIFKPNDLNQKELLAFAQSHNGLHDSILTDVIEWIKNTNDDLDKTNPFQKESEFIEKISKFEFSIKQLQQNLEQLKSEYTELPTINLDNKNDGINVDFDFYINQIKKSDLINQKNNSELIINKKALIRNLINDINKSYIKRKTDWELKLIEEKRKAFMNDLYEKIANFKKIDKLISPFIGDLGYLWDLSNSPFHNNGFEILKQYADLLENDIFLRELAKLLGRQSYEQTKYEKQLRDQIKIETKHEIKPAYRGEIKGLCLSNDISTVIPSELAMYKNLATKKYFMLKFAQKKLLSYSYERDFTYTDSRILQEEIEIEKNNEGIKGPIIICVDTSGSMHGAPERIAKTISFAIAKIAISENRKCYLISFSTGISTLDLSSFNKSNALEKLVDFLRMSFNGGTDISPALNHTVDLLQKENWKNSDVLMISDFIVDSFSKDLELKIKNEQKNKTGFFSLVIGNSENTQALKYFNDNWNYNLENIDAQKELVKKLYRLKNRELN